MSQFTQKLAAVALGDQFSVSFPLVQADGTSWTPNASAAELMYKTALADADADAVITKTLGDGITVVGSTATVTVTQADQAALTATVTLHWSLRITDSTLGPVTVAAGTQKFERLAVRS